MVNKIVISSKQNQKIKEIRNLIKRAKKERIFLLEGTKLIKEALDSNYNFIYLVISSTYAKKNKKMFTVLEKKKISYFMVTPKVLSSLSDLDTPPGILGVVKAREYRENFSTKDIFLLLENLQDPGNLGTIFRLAQGFEISGIYLSENSASPFNPKVVRASMGAVLHIKFFDQINFERKISELHNSGIKIYATNPHQGKNINEIKFNFPMALIIGSESKGISLKILNLADEHIRIPIEKNLDSLNVAVATGIILYVIKNKILKEVQ
jgi:TrmH family RNA methyltransferase